jgi:hypothetical protein
VHLEALTGITSIRSRPSGKLSVRSRSDTAETATNEDKRQAVTKLLSDDEWSHGRAIAKSRGNVE